MDKDYSTLDFEEKKIDLYLRQKRTLNLFLERNAISKAQYDKSLGDLTEKNGDARLFKVRASNSIKENIQDGNPWHMDHSNWVGAFDKLLSPDFIKAVQDHGFIELELNTIENDCYYISFSEQIKKLKQDVEDNQVLIMSTDDQDLYNTIISELDHHIVEEIESELKNQGVNPENEREIH